MAHLQDIAPVLARHYLRVDQWLAEGPIGGLLESGKVQVTASLVRGRGRASAQVKGRRFGINAPLSTNHRYRDLGVELTAAGRAVTIPCS